MLVTKESFLGGGYLESLAVDLLLVMPYITYNSKAKGIKIWKYVSDIWMYVSDIMRST
jgi:cephalosporin hydroxylase